MMNNNGNENNNSTLGQHPSNFIFSSPPLHQQQYQQQPHQPSYPIHPSYPNHDAAQQHVSLLSNINNPNTTVTGTPIQTTTTTNNNHTNFNSQNINPYFQQQQQHRGIDMYHPNGNHNGGDADADDSQIPFPKSVDGFPRYPRQWTIYHHVNGKYTYTCRYCSQPNIKPSSPFTITPGLFQFNDYSKMS
eukprot:UN00415